MAGRYFRAQQKKKRIPWIQWYLREATSLSGGHIAQSKQGLEERKNKTLLEYMIYLVYIPM